MCVDFGVVEWGSIVMPPDDALEAAWREFASRLPDRSDITPYQVARTREIFEAGWRYRAAFELCSGLDTFLKSLKNAPERR